MNNYIGLKVIGQGIKKVMKEQQPHDSMVFSLGCWIIHIGPFEFSMFRALRALYTLLYIAYMTMAYNRKHLSHLA